MSFPAIIPQSPLADKIHQVVAFLWPYQMDCCSSRVLSVWSGYGLGVPRNNALYIWFSMFSAAFVSAIPRVRICCPNGLGALGFA